MKKIAILTVAALCLGFTSCKDDVDYSGKPASNPQGEVLPALEATAEDVITTGNLDLTAESDAIAVLQITSEDALPEGYTPQYVMRVSKTEDMADAIELTLARDGGVINVDKGELDNTYREIHGKTPDAKPLWADYLLYAVNANNTILLGSLGEKQKIVVSPVPLPFVVEDNYYILGTINGWSVANALKMYHSGLDVYDDPVFSIHVTISDADAASGWWWKIVPQSTYEVGNWVDGTDTSFGVKDNGDESLSGLLVGRTLEADCGAGCIKTAGDYLLVINLMDGTYSFNPTFPCLYTPGDANGWNQLASLTLRTDNYAVYSGYAVLAAGGFKFSTQPNWGGVNYGPGDPGRLSTDNGAGNLSVAATGLYYCEVNVASLFYNFTAINSISIIGDAANGWNDDVQLTPSADFKTWSADVNFKASGEWKFRMNNDWTFNLGGTEGDLVAGGANLVTPGAGVYHVKLDFTTTPYSCIVGDDEPGELQD